MSDSALTDKLAFDLAERIHTAFDRFSDIQILEMRDEVQRDLDSGDVTVRFNLDLAQLFIVCCENELELRRSLQEEG